MSSMHTRYRGAQGPLSVKADWAVHRGFFHCQRYWLDCLENVIVSGL